MFVNMDPRIFLAYRIGTYYILVDSKSVSGIPKHMIEWILEHGCSLLCLIKSDSQK